MKPFNEFNLMTESAAYVKKSLVILRGVPGSGKSTFAELLSGGDTDIICCADDFFMQDGEYKWDRTKIGEAHDACKEKCASLIEKAAPLIIIANTNVRAQDFAEYMEMGEKAGYNVFSIVVENRHGGHNVHNVPDETIETMKRKFSLSL